MQALLHIKARPTGATLLMCRDSCIGQYIHCSEGDKMAIVSLLTSAGAVYIRTQRIMSDNVATCKYITAPNRIGLQ